MCVCVPRESDVIVKIPSLTFFSLPLAAFGGGRDRWTSIRGIS